MATPVEFDTAVIKIGDGAGTEVFTIACGMQDITTSFAANSGDRFVRDCAKPGEVPFRKTKVTGRQCDITANGLTDKANFGVQLANLGKRRNIRVEFLSDDGTDTGLLLGTLSGNFLIQALNVGAPRDGDSTAELQLASNGTWTWTAAP